MKKIVIMIVLIGAGSYIYNGNLSVFNKRVMVNDLYDKVSSTPVSALEAKEAFRNAVIKTCEINGVDTINGHGTTEECLDNFETRASEHCLNQITDFEDKTYSSESTLKADFHVFFGCSMAINRETFNYKVHHTFSE